MCLMNLWTNINKTFWKWSLNGTSTADQSLESIQLNMPITVQKMYGLVLAHTMYKRSAPKTAKNDDPMGAQVWFARGGPKYQLWLKMVKKTYIFLNK